MIEFSRANVVGTNATARAGNEDRVVVFQQLQVLIACDRQSFTFPLSTIASDTAFGSGPNRS